MNIKHLLIILTISIASCGDRASDSTPNQPLASNDPAPTSIQQSPPTQVAGSTNTPLAGTYWKVIELNGKNIEGKTTKEMYVFLDPSSPQMKSHSGCNMVMGEAKFTGPNQLRFTNLLNTTSPCNTPEIDEEFLKTMESITGYTHDGSSLILSNGKTKVMKLAAKA